MRGLRVKPAMTGWDTFPKVVGVGMTPAYEWRTFAALNSHRQSAMILLRRAFKKAHLNFYALKNGVWG
jgi:hypothetical protein